MLKKIISTVCFAVFSTSLFASEIKLDGKWAFNTDVYNVGINEKWYMPEHDTQGWRGVDVPGSWNTQIEYSQYTGVAWYRTEFDASADKNVDVELFFEGVYHNATVWLNGKELGSHDFGFTSFSFNITDAIDRRARNTIAVRVDNTFKLGATWNWGGIRRSVAVKQLPKQRLESLYVTSVPDLKRGDASVVAKVSLIGNPTGIVEMQICDSEGNIAAKSKTKLNGTEKEVVVGTNIKKAKLWNFDTPNLYTARVALTTSDGGRYEISDRFGVRKIEIDGYKLLINGVETRLNGANYVPDDRFTGSSLPEDVFKKDIDLLKSCGVNMARLSHLALPKNVLDYIDEKGILIFEEIPLWNKNHYVTNSNPTPLRWLTELISQRYNHPCIIGWSAGNEIGRLTDNPDLEGYLSSAFRHIKSLDSTRLSVYVTHTAAKQDYEPVTLSDMILFNQYGAHGERVDVAHSKYPGKPIFYSEYGTKVNSGDVNNGIIDYQAMMDNMYGREYLIGASVWTFNDYRSNYRDASTEATQNRPWGVVDAYRNKKRGFAKFQRINSPLKKFEFTTRIVDFKVYVDIEMQSRGALDIPAFDMKNYQLHVKYTDANGTLLHNEKLSVPHLPVGGQMQLKTEYLPDNNLQKVEVALVSPLGYEIETLTHHFIRPIVSLITHTESSDRAFRVYYNPHHSATEWYVKYSDGTQEKTSEKTICDYIEVKDCEFRKSYDVKLVAVNNAGEMESTQKVTVDIQAAELPPVIVHKALRGENIEVGYTSGFEDMSYEFWYGLSEEPDANWKQIFTTEGGACNLPVIKEGATHYLKIRKRLRYGYASPWSRTYVIDNIKTK